MIAPFTERIVAYQNEWIFALNDSED
jgi:hypothetical protein